MSDFALVEIPNQFICPVSLDIMSDPIICSDGYTYERVSILALTNSLSPMTRQPIDKTILIPNLALKQLIEQYAQTNGFELKKSVKTQVQVQVKTQKPFSNRLDNLQREREGMLTRFEREQREQEQTIQITIQRKRQEKQRKYQEDRERKRRYEQEDMELERVVAMFNTKDLPSLNSGHNEGCGYYGGESWKSFGIYKLKLNIGIIKIIKNKDIDELFVKYKKLCGDLIWIRKYVYGSEDSKPFVDYVFDNKCYLEITTLYLNEELNKLIKLHNGYNKSTACILPPCGGCGICYNRIELKKN